VLGSRSMLCQPRGQGVCENAACRPCSGPRACLYMQRELSSRWVHVVLVTWGRPSLTNADVHIHLVPLSPQLEGAATSGTTVRFQMMAAMVGLLRACTAGDEAAVKTHLSTGVHADFSLQVFVTGAAKAKAAHAVRAGPLAAL
jgi:hypothetical protein